MTRASLAVFSLLLCLHLAAIGWAMQTDAPTPPEPVVEPPKLQGMLIAPEPKIAKAPPPQPPEQVKPPERVQPPKAAPQPVKPAPRRKAPQPELKLASSQAPSAYQAQPAASKAEPPKPAPARPAAAAPATTASTELPSADAAGLNNKAPVYPLLSRKRKEQGTVWLLILVSKDGVVTELKLKTSSGFPRLDEAAERAVRHWKFQPARRQGEPIDYWYELPVKFSLHQAAG